MNIKEVTVTTKQLADFFKVAEKYISQLVLDHGMPKVAHNKFNLSVCINWRLEYLEKIHIENVKKIREENTKSRLERASAEIKEMELAEKKRSLIPAEEVDRIITTCAEIFKKGLEALETKLPPILINAKDIKEITTTLNSETESIRKQIADQLSNTAAEPGV